MDDLFEKKKEVSEVLDLSKLTVSSQEEFRAAIEKVPDFKIKQVKVKPEEIKIKDSADDQRFKIGRKELKTYDKYGTRGYERRRFAFMDPIPPEMKSLKMDDLYCVPIDWKMLTPLRPKTKLDEEFFSRLIEIGKSELRTVARDRRELTMNTAIRKTKNKAGVLETRIVSCSDCGEEFCDGKYCTSNNYDAFARVAMTTERKCVTSQSSSNQEGGKLRRIKLRGRRRIRSKSVANKTSTKEKAKTNGAKSDTEL